MDPRVKPGGDDGGWGGEPNQIDRDVLWAASNASIDANASTTPTTPSSSTIANLVAGDVRWRSERGARGRRVRASRRADLASVTLEELDRALVPLCGRSRPERAEVAPPSGFGARLARIEAVVAGFQLPDHRPASAGRLRPSCGWGAAALMARSAVGASRPGHCACMRTLASCSRCRPASSVRRSRTIGSPQRSARRNRRVAWRSWHSASLLSTGSPYVSPGRTTEKKTMSRKFGCTSCRRHYGLD